MSELLCEGGCGTPVRFPGFCTECGRAAIVSDVARSERRGKYNARAVEKPLRHASAGDGATHSFDSTHEWKRYVELCEWERAGTIRALEIQPAFPVHVHDRWGVEHHVFDYRADFRYQRTDDSRWVVEDAKGYPTAMYRLKKRAVEAQYSITINEV